MAQFDRMHERIKKGELIMSNETKIILSLVRPGTIVNIEPIKQVPNCEKYFKVIDVTRDGLVYGDGYLIPYFWINKIRIVG